MKNTSDVGRAFGNVNIDYSPLEWLTVKYTLGSDYSSDARIEGLPPWNSSEPSGQIDRANYTVFQIDHNLIAQAQKQLNGWVATSLTVGQNLNSRKYEQLQVRGIGYISPDLFQPSNTIASNLQPFDYESLVHLESYFGEGKLDLWDQLYFTAGAAEHKFALPANPDSKALEEFLTQQKATDPLRFPDLSLAVIKLLGAGEYVAELPGDTVQGHFGLAVKDYGHSTAPNRRYPDLITQRLLKAAIEGTALPYTKDSLDGLATHCTVAEDAANKVERQVEKAAAALLLESRIGEQFDAIVTGASDKGTWVRLLSVPVEGRLAQGFQGLDVGDRTRVQLVSTSEVYCQ